MYITNDAQIAKIAETSGVDWIFIDLEYKGKVERQGHLDTVISKHQIADIRPIKDVLTKSELLVRVNPIHTTTNQEIDEVIANGADIIMLPYFKTTEEVETFVNAVNNRVKTCLLLETPEAVNIVEEIVNIDGIDYIHIGLNDLNLGYNMTFMFELLCDGTVENLSKVFKKNNIPFGFGGIAQLNQGMLPAENIIMEHYRLGSQMAILSRTFFNQDDVMDFNKAQRIFSVGIDEIRNFENSLKSYTKNDFKQNLFSLKHKVHEIIQSKRVK